jgi:hypothetical protein
MKKSNKPKKLAIIGSRNFNDYDLLIEKVGKIENIEAIISGGASGADALAQQYAKDNGLPILIYYPDWDGIGRAAGFIRNQQIVNKCDELIAFVVNESKGSMHSVTLAKEKGVKVHLVKIKK